MSVDAVVGETNDGYLNDIRRRALTSAQILDAGTGTVAFDWKDGVGTSSRRPPSVVGGWTVGVLVQTNFGGMLTAEGSAKSSAGST
jgi:D-aminopeptidase